MILQVVYWWVIFVESNYNERVLENTHKHSHIDKHAHSEDLILIQIILMYVCLMVILIIWMRVIMTVWSCFFFNLKVQHVAMVAVWVNRLTTWVVNTGGVYHEQQALSDHPTPNTRQENKTKIQTGRDVYGLVVSTCVHKRYRRTLFFCFFLFVYLIVRVTPLSHHVRPASMNSLQ